MHKKPVCLLDLGGVVFQSSGHSNDVIDWTIISELNHIYGHDLNIGRNVFPDFLKDYNDRIGLNLDESRFLETLWKTLTINQPLIDGIRENYDIVIVSDNYRENIEYISTLFNFTEWAIDQYYSFDFQLEKSNPLFFQRLLKEMNSQGDDLVFIDDSQCKLDSAALSGIRGILFEGNKIVFEKLQQ